MNSTNSSRDWSKVSRASLEALAEAEDNLSTVLAQQAPHTEEQEEAVHKAMQIVREEAPNFRTTAQIRTDIDALVRDGVAKGGFSHNAMKQLA